MAEHIHTILETLSDSFHFLTCSYIIIYDIYNKDAKDYELNLFLGQFMSEMFLSENVTYSTIHNCTQLLIKVIY